MAGGSPPRSPKISDTFWTEVLRGCWVETTGSSTRGSSWHPPRQEAGRERGQTLGWPRAGVGLLLSVDGGWRPGPLLETWQATWQETWQVLEAAQQPSHRPTQLFFGYPRARGREVGWARSPQDGTS